MKMVLLKKRGLTSNYVWNLNYTSENSGFLVIGEYPHIYDQKKYDKENLKQINVHKEAAQNTEWNLYFNEIKYGDLDLKKINNGYIMLEVDLENGKVINHEGRHRIQLLKNNGYKKVQIIIMSKNNYYDENFAHNIGSLHLKHQMENESFTTTLTNLKILNKK